MSGGRGRTRPRSGARAAGHEARPHAFVLDDVIRFREDTFARRNWGHQGLRAALRGLSVGEARWTPGRGVHSVWEQINHVAHWKRYVLERTLGRSRQTSQAWPPAGRTAAELRRAAAALERLHRDLRAAIRRLSAQGYAAAGGPRYSTTQLLLGEAAHDAYHTGQILLTRKLYRRRRAPAGGRL